MLLGLCLPVDSNMLVWRDLILTLVLWVSVVFSLKLISFLPPCEFHDLVRYLHLNREVFGLFSPFMTLIADFVEIINMLLEHSQFFFNDRSTFTSMVAKT